MRQKGLIFSMSTLLLLSALLWFTALYSSTAERNERNIYHAYAPEKAGFVADDIISDFNMLLGTRVRVDRETGATKIAFYDKLPSDTNTLTLKDLNSFVCGSYSSQQNASISLNIERLVDGKTELDFSNGLLYENAYSPDKNFVQFRKRDSTDTGALAYDINVYATEGRLGTATPWPCDLTGDVNVNLRYSDSYGETSETLNCRQDSSATYTATFTLQDIPGSITVSYGSIDGNANSVRVKNGLGSPLVSVMTALEATMPGQPEELSWQYDADLNYTQQQAILNRKMQLGKA